MDTRSVVRSRRRSTRLTGHSAQNVRTKPPSRNKKRDSGQGTSSNSSSSASRESSCPRVGPNSKNASLSPNVQPRIQGEKPTNEATTGEGNGIMLPLFPNLHSSKPKVPGAPRTRTELVADTSSKAAGAPSEKAAKSSVSSKWVKTARGSIRLASDSPAADLRSDLDKSCDDAHAGQDAPPVTSGRRSRRLATMSPEIRDEAAEVEPLRSRRLTAIKAEALAPAATGSSESQESELDLSDPSTEATIEQEISTDPAHDDEPPLDDGEAEDALDHEPEHLKNVSPIPELVADIERIILSSPLAARDTAKHGADSIPSPTPTQAFKKRAPTIFAAHSRTLRSSSRSVEGMASDEKSLGFERADPDSPQVDGAFDDSLRRAGKKKAQAQYGRVNMPKPIEPRGTKRKLPELLSAEEDAPFQGNRQHREPHDDRPRPEDDFGSSNPIEADDLPRPEDDFGSSNPIEAATSRDTFAVDDPNVDTALDISEFARRSGEPPNPVTLAQMISTSSDRAASDNDFTRACDGSGSSSPERAASDGDSTHGHDGSREASPIQSPEGNRPTCADCGRAPRRYLVCAKCLAVIYCGKYCQLWNWPLHKTRCDTSDEASQADVEAQEAYLGDMWAAALQMLRDENMAAGGTVESLLLGEAMQHSPARPQFVGLQGRPRGFGGSVVGPSRSVLQDSESMDERRAMSIRVAQAAEGMQ